MLVSTLNPTKVTKITLKCNLLLSAAVPITFQSFDWDRLSPFRLPHVLHARGRLSRCRL
jgi:hypothetical protein